MLHRLSGTVSLAKLDHQTHLYLSNHLWNLTSSSYHTVLPYCALCACVRVYVCRQTEVCFDSVLVLCFVMGYVIQSGEIASTWKNILSLLSDEDCLSWQEGGDNREGTKKDALDDLLWIWASRASFFFIVNLTITGIVSKSTLGKLLRGRVERIIIGFAVRTDTILNWTGLNWHEGYNTPYASHSQRSELL